MSSLVPIAKTDSATAATAFFKEVICSHGCPRVLLSDRGTNFLSKLVLEVCKIMRTSKVNSSSHHPQCNAVQERFNAVILTTISHYVNKLHNNWDNFIPAIQFAYRSTPADNSIGFSPFFMLYGREAVLPIDVSLHPKPEYSECNDRNYNLIKQLEVTREISKKLLECKIYERPLTRYDRRTQEIPYQTGDVVYIYIPATQPGLSKKNFNNSGVVLACLYKQTGPVNFKVRNLENHKLLLSPIHVNRMKFAYNTELPRDVIQRDPLENFEDGDCPEDSYEPLVAKRELKQVSLKIPGLFDTGNPTQKEFQVEKVLRGKFVDGKLQYLIKWKDFSSSQNSWEPAENLNETLRDFLQRNHVRITGKAK